MTYRMVEVAGKAYLTGAPGETWIDSEQALLDFIVHSRRDAAGRACILLEDAHLPEAFFDLKTGLAGAILQKLINYRVQAAFVVRPERLTGRFGELAWEARRSSAARFFTSVAEAEAWLLA